MIVTVAAVDSATGVLLRVTVSDGAATSTDPL